MFKDFSRRLLFSRSTAYFILSFVTACSQVILRSSLYTVDHAGSLHSSSVLYPGFNVVLPPSPFPPSAQISGGYANESGIVQQGLDFKDGRTISDGRWKRGEAQTSRTADQFLWSLLPNGGFEVCSDLPGPCWAFTKSALDANRTTSNQNGGLGTFELCPFIAAYAANLFRDNRIEDIAFIAVHVYLLGLTFYTLARESIPHLIVIFVIRLLSTAWSLGRVIESMVVKSELFPLVVTAGCREHGSQFFLTDFWNNRQVMEGCLMGISILFTGVEAIVAYRLGKIYSKRPWRVVQVSKEMRQMYRLVLGFSILVQMSFLILPCAGALWVDQLINTWADKIVDFRALYLLLFISTTIVLPLWVVLGWFAIRRERRILTLLFMIIGFVLVGCWAAMFDSDLYRWTFTTWWFFGTLTTGALTLLIATLIMGVVCRRNFGKNLDHYLKVQSALSSSGFTHSHFDKCEKLDNAPIPGDPDHFWVKGKTVRFSSSSSDFLDEHEKSEYYKEDDGLDEQLGYIDVPLV